MNVYIGNLSGYRAKGSDHGRWAASVPKNSSAGPGNMTVWRLKKSSYFLPSAVGNTVYNAWAVARKEDDEAKTQIKTHNELREEDHSLLKVLHNKSLSISWQ